MLIQPMKYQHFQNLTSNNSRSLIHTLFRIHHKTNDITTIPKNPMTITHHVLSSVLLPWFAPFSEYLIEPIKHINYYRNPTTVAQHVLSSVLLPCPVAPPRYPEDTQVAPSGSPQASPSTSQELPQAPKQKEAHENNHIVKTCINSYAI